MAFNSMEVELLTAVYSLLSVNADLLASGINPVSGSGRTVAVFNQVAQNAPVPYVRITLTDTVPLQDEPYSYVAPTARTLSMLVDVFSDYEKEVFNIASCLESVLENHQFTTTHYNGSVWPTGTTFFTDNTTNPDRVLRRASMRLRANLQVT